MIADDAAVLARIPTLFRSPWLQGYSRGKLRSDPLYRASFERLKHSSLPLLDVGCGPGLHAFYLRERGFTPPILGVDMDRRKVAAAQAIAAEHYPGIELRHGDAAELPDFSGNVVLLDVLQYLPAAEQPHLLGAIAHRVAPGGWCLIRTTPRDASWRFRITALGEWFTGVVTWNLRRSLAFPSLAGITASFPDETFEREIQPLWGRTPFNSWLLAFRRRSVPRAPGPQSPRPGA